MKIISQRHECSETYYQHDFHYRGEHKNNGFTFPCDENGNLPSDLNVSARRNYENCVNGVYDVIDDGVVEYSNKWTEPAIGICDDCGKEVSLDGFTNTCDCGADYNMSGSKLAPRSQWGEETGESVQDILMADADYRRYKEEE